MLSRSTLDIVLDYQTPIAFWVAVAALLAVVTSYAGSRRGTDDLNMLILLFAGLLMALSILWLIAAAFITLALLFGWSKNDPTMGPNTLILILGAVATAYVYYKMTCVARDGPRALYQMRQRLIEGADQ